MAAGTHGFNWGVALFLRLSSSSGIRSPSRALPHFALERSSRHDSRVHAFLWLDAWSGCTTRRLGVVAARMASAQITRPPELRIVRLELRSRVTDKTRRASSPDMSLPPASDLANAAGCQPLGQTATVLSSTPACRTCRLSLTHVTRLSVDGNTVIGSRMARLPDGRYVVAPTGDPAAAALSMLKVGISVRSDAAAKARASSPRSSMSRLQPTERFTLSILERAGSRFSIPRSRMLACSGPQAILSRCYSFRPTPRRSSPTGVPT